MGDESRMGDESEEHVGHLLRLAQQVHTRMWANEVSVEVTSPQFRLLRVIQDHPGIDQRTATRLARLDRSTGAELIDRASRAGYVRRRRDGSDRRRYLLELSASGDALLLELSPAARHLHASMLALVPADLRQPFVEALVHLVDHAESGGGVEREVAGHRAPG